MGRRVGPESMAKARSPWRARRIKHRDAVGLSIASASCLLAGEFSNRDILSLYQRFIVERGTLDNPALLVPVIALIVLGFTTYFGGIFVLLGGLHFSWGRVGRGRFFVGLGIGVSLLGLISRVSRALLEGSFAEVLPYTSFLTTVGVLLGIISHSLMGQYALLLKKHASRVWRRWRKSRRPSRRSSKT